VLSLVSADTRLDQQVMVTLSPKEAKRRVETGSHLTPDTRTKNPTYLMFQEVSPVEPGSTRHTGMMKFQILPFLTWEQEH
jgi:hypothetical protein